MLPVDLPRYEYVDKTAIVIGAGIAGVSSAFALAKRGWAVTLLEQSQQIAAGASGNLAGIIMPSLADPESPIGLWHGLSYHYIQEHLSTRAKDAWFPVGVLQLMTSLKERHKKLYEKETLNQHSAELHVGASLKEGGVWFGDAGYLDPLKLCASFISGNSAINCLFNTQVTALSQDSLGQWTVECSGRQALKASVVVMANAHKAMSIEPCTWLPIKPLRGQVSYLPNGAELQSLKSVICADGYIIPAYGDNCCIGATYDYGDEPLVVTQDAHQRNLAMLQSMLPLQARYDVAQLKGRSSVRATTSDRLPIIGPVPRYLAYSKRVAAYYRAYKYRKEREVESLFYPGLYVNLAHGSRGLTTAPLSAEVVADLIEGTSAIPADIMRYVLAQRFLWRRKGNI